MHNRLLSTLVLLLASFVVALSASGNRLLVVLDDTAEESKYSKFFSDLKEQGYTLTLSTPKSDPQLFTHGIRNTDHLLLFPTRLKALGPSLTPNILLDFLKADGNILLALSSTHPVPTGIASLLLELDIHLPPDRTSVIVDHFNYDTVSTSESHDVLLLSPSSAGSPREDVKNYFIPSSDNDNTLLAFPHGTGHVLGARSPLLAPILKAPRTAYTYNPKDEESKEGIEEVFAAGQQLSLVSAMQARNSARLTVVGSAEMMEDAWFDASVSNAAGRAKNEQVKTANRAFVKRVAQWTFQELGVLKVGRVRHWLAEGEEAKGGVMANETGVVGVLERNPNMYRIGNKITYSIELSEHTPSGLQPFHLPPSDALQLEITMLSPYHRLALTAHPSPPPGQNASLYTTTLTLPDQHGIFSFRVNYKRPFLSYIDVKERVTLRHFAHDEWPRSWEISGAWPWVVGVWGVVVGWIGFVGIWLFGEDPEVKKRRREEKGR